MLLEVDVNEKPCWGNLWKYAKLEMSHVIYGLYGDLIQLCGTYGGEKHKMGVN